ncbi:maleylpyruvate isomerase N-terminal domain-containing protein [Herbidospora galbida]|uniref:maleylpyruvate isomerase N-terminal domain-containing protein n=1 Tax=Herbidospora galbida TaxID=2575442 RepID=UPI001BB0140C|nr:maleylpyruvate isomerase N-terminal domain-containing protein [Herbidospora galbida]
MTIFGDAIDVRRLFPVERRALLDLLDGLSPDDWTRPTVCPGWDVHDVVAHLVHDYARRLSGSRDGHHGDGFRDGETLPVFLARVNEEFVRAARAFSPAVPPPGRGERRSGAGRGGDHAAGRGGLTRRSGRGADLGFGLGHVGVLRFGGFGFLAGLLQRFRVAEDGVVGGLGLGPRSFGHDLALAVYATVFAHK